MNAEILLMWVALAFYAVGTAMYMVGVTFSKERVLRQALWVSAAGLAFQTASLGVRWVRLGHGPYLGLYEVVQALVWCVVVFFVVVAWRSPRLSAAGIAVMPVALILCGGSMLAPKVGLPITAKLASAWLVVHVAFANLAFGAFAVAFALAIAYVVRVRSAADGKWVKRFERLPAQNALEDLTVRYILVGFLFWGIMIATGAIWANEAWGRYWAWDPIETWSLIVWIIYAVYLHVRFTFKWSGERLAWFAIAAMPVALFALIGIPWAYNTTHAGIGGLGKDL